MSITRKYIEKYKKLPFKLFKKNGTEVVLLILDKKEEDELINKLELVEKITLELVTLHMLYGIKIEIDYDKVDDLSELLNDLKEVELRFRNE